MKLSYISPSNLPSRTANSIHVIMQCKAFSDIGLKVTLYAKRKYAEQQKTLLKIKEYYGVDLESAGIELVSCYNASTKAENLLIAFMAIINLLKRNGLKRNKNEIIISRNLYASFLLGIIFKNKILFETHQLENGIKKYLQNKLINAPWIKTIVISKKMIDCLKEHHKCRIKNAYVLHDAAPDGIMPLDNPFEREIILSKILPNYHEKKWKAICGYFGQLYEGRGIDIIEKMAYFQPEVLFLVVGGNSSEVNKRHHKIKLDNAVYTGHLPYSKVQKLMKAVDILLMPYQKKVSIGAKGHDTAKWMSPIKMFEYMASSVPIITSNLDVLKEVLIDEVNALMVPPDNLQAWQNALIRLVENKELAKNIGKQAHDDYKNNYTWSQRAYRLLAVAKSF